MDPRHNRTKTPTSSRRRAAIARNKRGRQRRTARHGLTRKRVCRYRLLLASLLRPRYIQ